MPFCSQCGTPHDAGAKFCSSCGNKLAGAAAPAPSYSSPSASRAAPAASSHHAYSGAATHVTASRVPVGDSTAKQQAGAFHGPSYGLDAELKNKMDSKYDAGMDAEVRQWMARKGVPVHGDLHSELKNGVKLCELANALQPRSVPRIQKAAAPFVQMENIAAFLSAAQSMGLRTNELFQTVDLFEAKNMSAVLTTLAALKRVRP